MADTPRSANRAPVRRDKAEQLVLVTLLFFGGSVMATRVFLELTGYPQLGGGGLHFAHVIWGGVFLFVATLLPIILANQWALYWSAATGGIGFGLFIDEVGKFITQTNDYFYPPAAPIVYTLFLITTLVYIHVRRPKEASPREELYRVLQGLTELLDHDLDATERAALKKRLDNIRNQSDDPQLLNLAESLDQYIQSEHIQTAPERRPQWVLKLQSWMKAVENFFTRPRLRIVLILSLGAVGVYSIVRLVTFGMFATAVFQGVDISPLVRPADIDVANQPLWYAIRQAVQGLVGFLSFLAAIYFVLKRDHTAVTLAILGLTFSLAVVNILVYYLDQFSATFGALFEFAVLMGVAVYRQRFLITPRTPTDPPVKL